MIDDILPDVVRQALEACRPDHPDERLPEIAAVLANGRPEQVVNARRSIEGVDRAVMTAMRQAPVPEGLAERVLARIAMAQQTAALGEVASDTEDDAVLVPADRNVLSSTNESATPTGGRRSSRPGMVLVACGAFGLAAALLIAFLVWPRGTVELADIQSQVIDFYESDKHGANNEPLPTALGGVAADKVIGWHRMELFRRSGYGYDLVNRGTKGTLYVLPRGSWLGPKFRGLNALPVPQSTSGATVAAWADDTFAYILVVKGGRPAFAGFLPHRVA